MRIGQGWSLAIAKRIADRLLARAENRDGGLQWTASETIRGTYPPRSELKPVEWGMYRGNAGIALFLTETARLSGRDDLLEAARRALVHAHSLHREEVGDGFRQGLHAGSAGLIHATGIWLGIENDSSFQGFVDETLAALDRTELESLPHDLIAGAAGTIIGLLSTLPHLDHPLMEAASIRLGDYLVKAARVEHTGISWEGGGVRAANLCGLAHGAAGIAWPLLELFQLTGRESFRLAAEEALEYEQTWYDPEVKNWADLRNGELARMRSQGRLAELPGMLDRGEELPAYRLRYMSAWCHGAPGIGMVRARAFEVTRGEEHRRLAAAALSEYLAVDDSEGLGSHSVCHGSIGNLLCVHATAQMLGLAVKVADIAARAKEIALRAEHRETGWIPGGFDRGVYDPSMMLGETGVGLALLGFEHRVASAVFPDCGLSTRSASVHDADSVLERIAAEAFPRTRAAIGDTRWSAVVAKAGLTGGRAISARVGEAIDLELDRDRPGELDAYRREGCVRELQRAGFDRSVPLLLQQLPVQVHGSARYVRSPWVRVERAERPFLACFDGDDRAELRPLGEGAASLIECLETPDSLDGLAAQFADGAEVDRDSIVRWVAAQLRELLVAGFVLAVEVRAAVGDPLDPRIRRGVWKAGNRTAVAHPRTVQVEQKNES